MTSTELPRRDTPGVSALSAMSGAAIDADIAAGQRRRQDHRSSRGEVVVIDTSALVADPDVLDAHGAKQVVIPLTVLEELDHVKQRLDAGGANARAVIRKLDEIRLAAPGRSLTRAVSMPEGGTLRVEANGLRLDELTAFHLDPTVADHKILAAALGLAGEGHDVTVISCDAAMRLKADTVGLTAEDHVSNQAVFSTADVPGWAVHEVRSEFIDALYAEKFIATGDPRTAGLDATVVNEFLIARAGTSSALARRTRDGFALLDKERSRPPVWGIRPRNKEQRFALELLSDPEVEVVALSGKAGTGKTLLAIAAGLEQTFEGAPRFDRIMVLRPMYSVGRQDIGFLPGDVSDKVAPWFDSVVDAMVALSTNGMDHKQARDTLEMWVGQGKLTMEPVTFLRGRSLQRHLLVIDEVQNLEKSDVKTVLTRLGAGSKIVACGDPDQCDNPFTSPTSNGMTALVDAFRGQSEFGHIALTECERSRIAGLAADLL